jgi:hypothetical protein
VSRRVHKAIHAAATVWFFVTVAYLVVSALRAAGVGWLVIFSLSGQSAAVLFLFMTVYLFAIFRGASRARSQLSEHPLTGSKQYLEVYSLMPFFGGLVGLVSMLGVTSASEVVAGCALGTLLSTFVLWIVIDPLLGAAELLVPSCRAACNSRRAKEDAIRKEGQANHERFLKDLEEEDSLRRRQWQQEFAGEMETLAGLVRQAAEGGRVDLRKAIDVGLHAWQSGGVECMQFLRERANEAVRAGDARGPRYDFLAHWWHGVGGWRHYV